MGGMSPLFLAWKQRSLQLLRPVLPLWDAVQLWLRADGLRMSAAMSFYGMLSLAPLLLLIVALLGWWVDRSYVEQSLVSQVQAIMGERGASVVRGALDSAQEPSEGWMASALAFVLLMSGASGVFVELQASLEKLWRMDSEEPPQTQAAWWRMASLRLRGLAYVMALGFLLLVSMLLSAMLRMLTTWAGTVLPVVPLGPLLALVHELVSFGIAVLLFVGLMRIGSGPKPATRYLVFGAVVGATLFTLGKQALAWYLSTAAVVSAYGAAGSVVVLLMWIYVTSAILLLAASCAKALDRHRATLAWSSHPGARRPPAKAAQPASGIQPP